VLVLAFKSFYPVSSWIGRRENTSLRQRCHHRTILQLFVRPCYCRILQLWYISRSWNEHAHGRHLVCENREWYGQPRNGSLKPRCNMQNRQLHVRAIHDSCYVFELGGRDGKTTTTHKLYILSCLRTWQSTRHEQFLRHTHHSRHEPHCSTRFPDRKASERATR
jgi:hypothetical protein